MADHIGGADATACPEEVLGELPEADYVVAGEAEESFVELLGALKQGNVVLPEAFFRTTYIVSLFWGLGRWRR